jgi:hypothetical protein
LIARVGGRTFDTKDAFDRLLSKNREAEAFSNMRELLLLCPLDLELRALVMIVMVSRWAILESLSVVNLLGLTEPGAGWFPPTMVELEEHVVEMLVSVTDRLYLVEALRNIADLVEVLGAYLANMQVNQVAVKAIDFKHFVLSEPLGVDVMVDMNMLMR